jgi:transcriptional regulator with XRE-family HTH domain
VKPTQPAMATAALRRGLARALGSRLRQARLQAGLTQKALATAADRLPSEQVSRWEAGSFLASLDTLLALTAILHTTPGRVLTDRAEWAARLPGGGELLAAVAGLSAADQACLSRVLRALLGGQVRVGKPSPAGRRLPVSKPDLRAGERAKDLAHGLTAR